MPPQVSSGKNSGIQLEASGDEMSLGEKCGWGVSQPSDPGCQGIACKGYWNDLKLSWANL